MAQLVQEIAGGGPSSAAVDDYPRPVENAPIRTRAGYFAETLGDDIPDSEAVDDEDRLLALAGIQAVAEKPRVEGHDHRLPLVRCPFQDLCACASANPWRRGQTRARDGSPPGWRRR